MPGDAGTSSNRHRLGTGAWSRRELSVLKGATRGVTIATVLLVGIDELARVPDYLELGAVVVIAPDRETMRQWRRDQDPSERSAAANGAGALVIDLLSRRILCFGRPINLSELEFRVLAALLSHPGRAWSFRDLRRAGWGEGLDLPVDVYSVRSLVQRLRLKLGAAEAPATIEAVRGFGFRIQLAVPDHTHLPAESGPQSRTRG
jgi:DNA-binding winged helix-turn-helix (wHTH) protein